MKVTTWNVNGLRARLTHVIDFLRAHKPDVLCLQETKVQDELFPKGPIEDEGYDVAWFGQNGYNGVAILATDVLADVDRGLPDDAADAEKRVITATAAGMRIVNLYCPNGTAVGSDRYAYKLDWFRRLRTFLDARHAASEPMVVVGDFNVALEERDVNDPAWWHERILCSTPERQAMRNVMAFGLVDCLRQHHAESGIYTWWDYRASPSFRDEGLRIDYVLATARAAARCTDVIVHKEVRQQKSPSDHAPVTAIFAPPENGRGAG